MIFRILLFSCGFTAISLQGALYDPLPFDGDSPQIMVDQFGFLPEGHKVAIFADPVEGFNNSYRIEPGDLFEIRTAVGNDVVLSGKWRPFRDATVDPVSGDRVWWADFSSLRVPGTYVIVDPGSEERSHPFSISDSVYAPVLKAACRMFYYNRSGIAKEERYAGRWTHGPNHEQNKKAQFFDTEPRGNPRDVSGGWWDAGDFNKYSRFTTSSLIHLFHAYELNPEAFPDNWNIPESGNGIPDFLDEIRWELEWLLKMQDADSGGVHNISGTINGRGGDLNGKPENASLPWYYTSKTTWSTAGFAAANARASVLYQSIDDEFSATLLATAEKAWSWLEAHPEMHPAHGNDTSNGLIAAGDSTGDGGLDERHRLWAAAELFRATGKNVYHAYFLKHHLDTDLRHDNHHPLLEGILDGHKAATLNHAYLAYAQAEGADKAIVARFERAVRRTMDLLTAEFTEDAYRNDFTYYWWGSNGQRARRGALLHLPRLLGFPEEEQEACLRVAAEYAHYLHGRNPLNLVYLSNMGPEGAQAGAERSVQEVFHYWFADNTRYDGLGDGKIGPAPGYLVGGPNAYFEPDWISPPHGQPPAKSFLEFNTGWSEQRHKTLDPWSITEPAIYYQAFYINLLAPLARP